MKIIYMGTPEFAVDPLIALHQAKHEICMVITQPDKPNSRRGNEVLFSPVKKTAMELGLPIFQPKNVSSFESEQHLRSLNADVVIVCAFGQILKKNILALNPHGCINIHASLLPKYRGAAPIHRCIINGERVTGITVMYMDEGLDSGDIMISQTIDITNEMTVGQLYELMRSCSGALINKAVDLLETGQAPRIVQDDTQSTYADKISKAECEIDFNDDVTEIYNRIRGLNPFPTAFTYFNHKIIKLYDVEMLQKCYNIPAGSIIGCKDNALVTACKNGSILVKTLKPEGKRLMSAPEFWAGLQQKENIFFGK